MYCLLDFAMFKFRRRIIFCTKFNCNCYNSENFFFTDDSLKRKITASASENLTDSNLESSRNVFLRSNIINLE